MKKYFIHIKQNMLMSDIYKTYRTYDNTYMYIHLCILMQYEIALMYIFGIIAFKINCIIFPFTK